MGVRYYDGEIVTLSLPNATGVLNTVNGGLGAALTPVIGDILYASSTTVFARLAAVATGQFLVSAGTGTAPAWDASPSCTGLLTATGGFTSGGNIISDTDSTDDLGTTSVRWANLYVDSIGDTGAVLAMTAGANNITMTAGVLAITGGLTVSTTCTLTGVVTCSDDVVSDTDSTDDLGTTGVRWANLFVDGITMGGTLAGAVATFSSTLAVTGIATFGDDVVSDTDSTDDLGTTGVRWANLWVDAITLGGTLAGAVATFSSTVLVTGILTTSDDIVSDADSTDDLGTTGVRWANLFVDSIGDTGQALTINADIVVTGTTPKITVGDAGAEDTIIVFDGNAVDFYLGLEDTGDIFSLGIGSALGTTPQLSFDAASIVFNEDSGDYDFRVEGDNNANMIVMDSTNSSMAFGAAIVDGAAFSLNNLTKRTAITVVGNTLHLPAQTIEHDNTSETIAVGATVFLGIQTLNNDTATLTITDLCTLYVEGPPVDNTQVTATTKYAVVVEAGNVRLDDSIYMLEKADANAEITGGGYGQIWVNTATPNELWFTDDAGNDFIVSGLTGSLTKSGTPLDNQIAIWTSATNLEGDAELTYDGTSFILTTVGPHCIGGGVLDYAAFRFTGSFTSQGASTIANYLRLDGTITGASADTGALNFVQISPTVNTQTDEEGISIISSLRIDEPNITDNLGGAEVIAAATTLYIKNAPNEATNNYALWVDAGASRFDGSLGVGTGTATLLGIVEVRSASVNDVMSVIYNTNTTAGASVALHIASESTDTTTAVTIENNGAGTMAFRTGATTVGGFGSIRMQLDTAGGVFINESTNANMTIGLTINLGSANGHTITLKDAGVAHGGVGGIFEATETDDFGYITKAGSAGGLVIAGIQDSTTIDYALSFTAQALDADVDAVDTNTRATVMYWITQHNSAGALADMEADANVYAVVARVGAAFRTIYVVNEDGDTFIDGTGPTAFDEHKDAELLEKFEKFMIDGRKEADWATMKANYKHDDLVAVGLAADTTEEDWNSGIRPLVPMSAQLTLLSGTARQEHGIVNALMDVMEEDPQFRGKMRAALVARGLGNLARPDPQGP